MSNVPSPVDFLSDPDHPEAAPRLVLGHSWWALGGLDVPAEQRIGVLQQHGFESIEVGLRPQTVGPILPAIRDAGLKLIGQIHATEPADALPGIDTAAELGCWAVNVHLGHAFLTVEHAAEACTMLEEYGDSRGVFVMIETHRGRLTQSLQATETMLENVSSIKFCLDVSHYILCCETDGNNGRAFLASLEPIIHHTAMVHGRFSSGEQIQVAVPESLDAIGDGVLTLTVEVWRRAFANFRKFAKKGDVLLFTPELGPPPYAITNSDGEIHGDRWEASLRMARIAKEVWEQGAK